MDESLADIYAHSLVTRYYNLASFVMIVYDHSLTFDLEVKTIWKQSWSLPKVLWFVFRYLNPIHQIGSILADHLDNWTSSSCMKWLWFRIIVDEIVVISTSGILILRVWLLFERARWTLMVLASALLGQIGVTIWAWQAVTVAPLTLPGENLFIGCSPAPKSRDRTGQVASLYIGFLVLDTVIFLLTVLRLVAPFSKLSRTSPLVTMMLRDGVLYILVIFVANLANAILIQLPSVPLDLRALNTEFTDRILVTSLVTSENQSSSDTETLKSR
ncbi:hypothetical protein JB92DRAFT_1313264 [Gautieria morchelliformis]|nr:hypothetical protein JB92DRAFT_1313264 [Gautieria morchelliformis]